jgi:hypothetical protein
MTKPNCYECKHRCNTMGSHHSECKHPDSFFLMVASMIEPRSSKVKGNPHGIANGWFYWPLNFDPVWLESCELFEKIPDKDK